ncbi:thioester domain-containing protein [Microbacterium sp. BLY]|uniref:thioester domain-containing protein n=1 Tax=Microbacterium sp. BLY TaxID=2823280 RepID=UPI001B323394|nr:thioester domain-containing protein [Microbacterium sp. BLY]MBP3978195.1 thioester domain-containing protein [Microbacterium sp. BLY]
MAFLRSIPRRSSASRSSRRAGVAGGVGLLLVAFAVAGGIAPAQATLQEPTRAVETQVGPDTEIQLTSLGNGLTIDGLQPPAPTTQDPLAPYPTGNPAGYTRTSTFAGTINAASISDPSLTAEMYCINLRVSTYVGVGYQGGTWEETNVPNIGYVTYILNNYHPTTGEPSTLSVEQRAAAVQAAIWYFTDGFVVSTPAPGPVRAAVAAIVQDAQTNGPVVEPERPVVEITPDITTAPADGAAGPYTVTAEGASEVTVTAPAGYTLHASAESTTPLPNPSVVAPGTQLWLRSTSGDPGSATLNARAAVTVQRGSVYLYDGYSIGLSDAQRLILADTTELDAVDTATAELFESGSIIVDKTFAGEAAGAQGAVQITVDCGTAGFFTYDIAAGETAPQSFTASGIPVGTACTVEEPVTGASDTVIATSTLPQTAEASAEGTVVTAENTYSYEPGSLRVIKSISGLAAGAQDDVTVAVECGDVLDETWTVPAGSPAGDYEQTFTGLPAGTACTVSELATGETAEVVVTASDPVEIEILPAATVDAALSNVATFRPGDLRLVKTISGAGAGLQGAVSLQVDCGAALTETFVIPARSAAGDYERTFVDLPAGTECTVTETNSGSSSEVRVGGGDPVTVTIVAGGSVGAAIANEVTAVSESGPGLAQTGGSWRLDLIVSGLGAITLGLWVLLRRRRTAA